MTKEEQRALLRNFGGAVIDELLARSESWPEEWDGHDLRELVFVAFEHERSRLMTEPRSKRRRDCRNEILVRNLY